MEIPSVLILLAAGAGFGIFIGLAIAGRKLEDAARARKAAHRRLAEAEVSEADAWLDAARALAALAELQEAKAVLRSVNRRLYLELTESQAELADLYDALPLPVPESPDVIQPANPREPAARCPPARRAFAER
jgi:hypothetical protein